MSADPAVVVGVPMYGREQWLREALDSLLSQTYRRAAFILVDDCSPDRSFAIASELAGRDDRVVVVRNEQRLGLVGAWRRAFDLARELQPGARYFAWGSDHDHWEPEWLAALVEVLDSSPDAVLAYPNNVRLDAEGTVVHVPRGFDTGGERSPRRRLTRAASGMSPGNMVYGLVRVSALERAGPFPYVMGPDRLLLAHLAVLGEFRQVPDVLWHRRFTEKVNSRRQRRAFFPGRRPPWHTYIPWWLVHGAILAWRYGARGVARPELSRAAGLAAATSYVGRSAFARLLRNLNIPRRYARRAVGRSRRAAGRLLGGRASD